MSRFACYFQCTECVHTFKSEHALSRHIINCEGATKNEEKETAAMHRLERSQEITYEGDTESTEDEDEDRGFNEYDCHLINQEDDYGNWEAEEDLHYCLIQEEIYRQNFSIECLMKSTDLETFISLLPEYTDIVRMMIELYHFQRKASLSRECGNELLSILNRISPDLVCAKTKDWRAIHNFVEKSCAAVVNTALHKEVPWPDEFRMDLWDEAGKVCPPPVQLIGRDLLELIALKLACPSTMYINAKHVQLEYAAEYLQDGTPCYTNLMSSDYAKNTEEDIRQIHSDGIMIPIITYADGVALGVRNKVSCTNDSFIFSK